MSHPLPTHSELNTNMMPSSLQSALQMDQSAPPGAHAVQHPQQQQQPQPQQQPPPNQQSASRRRRRTETGDDATPSPSEPRRLRRSHEACARCRNKKIKCDAKHPRCTACATAGVPCHQEDRYRQTLTLRGHTEHIEHQLRQCEALLKRHYHGFDLNKLDEYIANEGIEVEPSASPTISAGFQFAQPSQSPTQHPRSYVYPAQMAPPGYPMGVYNGPPPHGPYQHIAGMPPQGPPPGPFGHPLYPPPHFQQPHGVPPNVGPAPPARPPSVSNDIKGQDPQFNDMSNTEALVKTFGVSSAIVDSLKIVPGASDREDLAVGSSGLTSGRDRDITNASSPRDKAKWMTVSMRRNSFANAPAMAHSPGPTSTLQSLAVWLPKDRTMVKNIVGVYFTRLNVHRPVFSRAEFERTLDALYDGQSVQHDPGYICSLYLILALGTLSELSHRASEVDKDNDMPVSSPTAPRKLMPHDWPEHDEFFERALAVKPDLRVTISSLQALILLQWYLYTERQGRTLWRLVGSLVRLSIELGLHHDPTVQGRTFTEEECQLRIRLWGIVMVHDRGTSILLGRPLAIAPSDSNTPRPSRGNDFSEHFLLSHDMAEIQADIINSLYTPSQQKRETIMRHATRIIKSMVEFRRRLPESYKWYFGGTDDWPLERKAKLVQDINEDQGLTLLKLGISRILLLRALFSSKELEYEHRRKALHDAIITSHNIIIVHQQLIRFPDIGFFVSPIPLHIAAMVILYGHMSELLPLTREVAIEDVWMALDMLPRLRWRWERKDLNGGHPLIARLAEVILKVNLRTIRPTRDLVLLPEKDSETEVNANSPSINGQQLRNQQSTPPMGHANYSSQSMYGPQARGGMSGPGKAVNGMMSTSVDNKHLMDVPAELFYPFYPERTRAVNADLGGGNGVGNGHNQDFNNLLAAAAQPDGTYGCQPSQDSYMQEEKDPGPVQPMVQMWMSAAASPRTQMYPLPQS